MTQHTFDTAATAGHAWTLVFTWGDGHVVRLTTHDVGITVGGDAFSPCPMMDIRWPIFRGGTEDDAIEVTLPSGQEPLATMSAGHAHADVRLVVGEVDPTNTVNFRELWFGTIEEVVSRPDGVPGKVRCKGVGIKARLAESVGIAATSTCQWVFGGVGCNIDAEALEVAGEVTTLGASNRQVTVDFSPAEPDFAADRWRRGFLRVDGLRVQVRAVHVVDANTARFDLVRVVPLSWVGQTVTARPGCDGRVATCTTTWDNERQFGGFGIMMPSRNPVFELGGTQ